MNEKLKASLLVNNISIDLNDYSEQFLANTVMGAVSSLKGAEDIRNLELYLEQGNVRVTADGNELSLTPFPNDIIANTVIGLVSSLKGVGKIDTLRVDVNAR